MSASAREQAKQYLSEHRIPQLFESLLSSLMMERPDNPVEYIEKKMCQIKEIGLENVNWETLVAHLHPYRDNVRRQYIRDESVYDKEYAQVMGEMKEYSQQKQEHLESIAQERSFEPEVFQLTEAHS